MLWALVGCRTSQAEGGTVAFTPPELFLSSEKATEELAVKAKEAVARDGSGHWGIRLLKVAPSEGGLSLTYSSGAVVTYRVMEIDRNSTHFPPGAYEGLNALSE